jgi:hypothetical protein
MERGARAWVTIIRALDGVVVLLPRLPLSTGVIYGVLLKIVLVGV